MTIKLKVLILIVCFLFISLNEIYDGHARTIESISDKNLNSIDQVKINSILI